MERADRLAGPGSGSEADDSPANASSISACTPAARKVVQPFASMATSSSNAVFPIPGSPRNTSVRLWPARNPSTSSASCRASRSRPIRPALFIGISSAEHAQTVQPPPRDLLVVAPRPKVNGLGRRCCKCAGRERPRGVPALGLGSSAALVVAGFAGFMSSQLRPVSLRTEHHGGLSARVHHVSTWMISSSGIRLAGLNVLPV